MEKKKTKDDYRKESFDYMQMMLFACDTPKWGRELHEVCAGITYRRMYDILATLVNRGYMTASLEPTKYGRINRYTRIKFYSEADYWADIQESIKNRRVDNLPFKTLSPNIQVVYANKYAQLSGDFKEINQVEGTKYEMQHSTIRQSRQRVYVGSVYNGMML